MRGGKQWKSGSDTCVFSPPVKCEGDAEAYQAEGFVSRIVPAGSREEDVETLLRRAFPLVVAQNGVTIHTRACTPDFTAADLEQDAGLNRERAGCRTLAPSTPGVARDRLNLVTPRRMTNLAEYLAANPLSPEGRKALLENALDAAVTLVPDSGPWVVHADCHPGNVLVYKRGNDTMATSLSDWGRVVVLPGAPTVEAVRRGLWEWLLSMPHIVRAYNTGHVPLVGGPTLDGLNPATDAGKLTRALRYVNPQSPQHPSEVMDKLVEVFRADETKHVNGINALRGWVPYVLLKQVTGMDYTTLLRSTSQADLRQRLTQLLASAPTPAPAPAPAPVASSVPAPKPAVAQEGGVYWPRKYHRGLTRRQNAERRRTATRRTRMSWRNPKAYVPWRTDKGVKTRRSSYTSRFRAKYPTAKSIREISAATKVPSKTLKTVYNRGMAAWRTGHRPGASQHAWGMARVHSFVLKGKTYRTADKDLAEKT